MEHSYNVEIVYGIEDIIIRTLKRFSTTSKKIDVCISAPATEGTVITGPIFNAVNQLKEKGIKIRYITEITEQNISYCKDLMKTGELRHMDEIKGNFAIVDERDYQATAEVQKGGIPLESVIITARAFVEQQQFIFDMLWKKAIPAKQRIKEIEQGFKREFIDIIRDPIDILYLIIKVLKSTTDELQVLFSSSNAFQKLEY